LWLHCSYIDIMTAITVRDVPAEIRDELATRAARSGRSLQEYLRQHLIEVARRPDADTVVERVRARVELTGSPVTAADIVRWRDEERR